VWNEQITHLIWNEGSIKQGKEEKSCSFMHSGKEEKSPIWCPKLTFWIYSTPPNPRPNKHLDSNSGLNCVLIVELSNKIHKWIAYSFLIHNWSLISLHCFNHIVIFKLILIVIIIFSKIFNHTLSKTILTRKNYSPPSSYLSHSSYILTWYKSHFIVWMIYYLVEYSFHSFVWKVNGT